MSSTTSDIYSSAYFNGKYVNYSTITISINDRGFLFGDGIYEVILLVNGKLIDFDLHAKRLFRSISFINLFQSTTNSTTIHEAVNTAIPQSADQLLDIIQNLLKQNNASNGSIYIQITRGDIGKRDHNAPQNPQNATIIISIYPSKPVPEKCYKSGISVITESDIRWQRRDIKTIQLLPNILAKQKAIDLGYDDAIFVDSSIITEATSSNVIIFKNSTMYTHPNTNKILHGCTKHRVINLGESIGIKTIEESFTLPDLLNCDGVILTSATLRVRPVTKVDSHLINKGYVHKDVKAIFNEYEKFIGSGIICL